MTRRDFELIARVIADHRPAFKSTSAHVAFAEAMSRELARDSNGRGQRFDRIRFLQACQPGWTVGTRFENAWEAAFRR